MKKLIAIVLIPLLLLAGSCTKYLECDDCVTDPNNPSITTAAMLLTIGQVATFSTFEGKMTRLPQIFTQHLAGTDFQYYEFANFNITDSDFENEWNQIYADCQINMKLLIDEFGAENPWYRGMAKIIQAMNLGITTDNWGDIPWREALQGTENLNPHYDSQEFIYSTIQSLLSEAIEDLSEPAEANKLFPGLDDLIYGGDPEAWIRIAWVLKARYANHLSKLNPANSASDAINYLNQAYAAGFASPANDMNAVHGEAGNELNQWYAFEQNRANYLKMGKPLVDLMLAKNDPRLSYYAALDDNGGYSGTEAGDNDVSTSSVGPYFASPTSSFPLVTYVEAKFIEAEAKLRLGEGGDAASAHNEAIKAHVRQVTGADDPVFYAAEASETGATITLDKIMTHKYIAMFLQNEVWVDWRRTGIPSLSGPGGKEIPRRLVTPIGENANNVNSPKIGSLYTPRLWWDTP
ncbi:MAG TPA: SusD/RagB family nutrient-binding outer membrane lipoprotein [Chitinophagales bacterium]|nr:SusD/RagB family nutrient-binding outer membrane lipoprotein [Chitinophagales bacterium]